MEVILTGSHLGPNWATRTLDNRVHSHVNDGLRLDIYLFGAQILAYDNLPFTFLNRVGRNFEVQLQRKKTLERGNYGSEEKSHRCRTFTDTSSW